MEKTVH